MKNFLGAISLFFLSSATLADISGFYAGLNAGLYINSVTLAANHAAFTGLSGVCNSNGNFLSFSPGAQVGYVHDFDSRLMLGVEADFSYNVGQQQNLACQCPTTPDVSDRFAFINRMQGSVRGRLGYAITNTIIPFITAGGSLADLALSYSNEIGDSYSTGSAQFGWLVGAGVEWKLACNWSIRGEYHFVDFVKVGLSMPTIYGLTDPAGAAHANSFGNNFRLAFNYWF